MRSWKDLDPADSLVEYEVWWEDHWQSGSSTFTNLPDANRFVRHLRDIEVINIDVFRVNVHRLEMNANA